MKARLYRFFEDERGSEPVEYIVLTAIVITVTLVATLELREAVADAFGRILNRFLLAL